MTPANVDLTHISGALGETLKEILRRAELRPRLVSELGRPLSDQEFLAIAEKSGLKF